MGKLVVLVVAVSLLLVVGCGDDVRSDDGSGGSTGGAAGGAGATSSDGGAGPCMQHAECADDRVCLNGTCELAWGRQFQFTVVSATIAQMKPNSDDWDATGLPDPFVEIYQGDGDPVFTTTTKDDTLSPTWEQGLALVLDKDGPPVRVPTYDEDVAVDDTIIVDPSGRTVTALLADIRMNGGDYTVTESGSTLLIHVEPL